MMKKILVLVSLVNFTFIQGMEHLDLRQKINNVADQYRLLPQWVEDHLANQLINQAIMRELSHDLAFPPQPFIQEDKTDQKKNVDLGGELEPATMQHTLNHDQHNHFEVNRRLEQLQSHNTYHPSIRSSVPNPETVQGWMYKDEWIYPFVSAPDISKDPEINRFKKQLEAHDAASLTHEIANQQSRLKNCSFIDRMNRYKISRRLSFLAKHIRQDAALHYLLLIHKANRLEDACFGFEQLQFLLHNRESIEINGKQVTLNDPKISEITQVARRFIEQRIDYQEEKRKYPDATIGGQLLNRSPILTRIDMALLKKGNSLTTSSSSQKSIDPFTDVLTQKVKNIPSVEDQIAALTDLQVKITANPATDFPTYVQQVDHVINTLKDAGKWTAETAELIFKGFIEGAAEHIVHTVRHPIEYAQSFVQGNIKLIQELGLLTKDLLSAPDDFIFVNEYEMQQYQAMIQRRSESIAQMYHTLCETIPQISREDWGRISGQLFTDYFIFKGAGKGLNIVKNANIAAIIKENPLLAKVQQGLEQALLKNPEMVTTEGVTIKGAQEAATEQSLLQKMSSDTQKAKKLNTEVSVGKMNTSVQLLENETNYITKTINGKTFLEVQHPVIDSIRTDSALKFDPHHAFDNRIDNFVRYASKFSLEGNDGIVRELYQLEGSLDGINGVFEWILDPRPEKGVTHRLFIKDGTITGKPNIRIKK